MNETPQYLLTIPASEYHAATRDGTFLSSHMMIDFMRCPLIYKMKLDGVIVQAQTDAMSKGSAVHTLILEGMEAFDAEYTVADGPINEKTGLPFGNATKAYKEWAAAQSKPVVSTEEFDTMLEMCKSVKNHFIASRLLANGYAEKVVRFNFIDIPAQVRLDWFNPELGMLCDLKTCENIENFARAAINYGYIEQMAFYRNAIKTVHGDVMDVYLIAVERVHPFRCAVYRIDDDALDLANAKICRAIFELKECRERGYWPTRYEGVKRLDFPERCYHDADAAGLFNHE